MEIGETNATLLAASTAMESLCLLRSMESSQTITSHPISRSPASRQYLRLLLYPHLSVVVELIHTFKLAHYIFQFG
jgi:hypothetical protein